MLIFNKPTANANHSGWSRAGALCLLAGALAACGGGGGSGDSAAAPAGPATATAASTTVVKSVEKNDPLAFSENRATVKIAETRCRKHTYVRNGDSSIRTASREGLRKDRCEERGTDDGREPERVG